MVAQLNLAVEAGADRDGGNREGRHVGIAQRCRKEVALRVVPVAKNLRTMKYIIYMRKFRKRGRGTRHGS